MFRGLSVFFSFSFFFVACINNQSEYESISISTEEIKVVELGNTVEEIISTLKKVTTYQDILKILGPRNHKNLSKIQALDFGTHFISESMYSINNWEVRVNYIVQGNKLGYGMIVSIDSSYKNLISPTVFFEDLNFIHKYVKQHNDFYDSNYSTSQMLNEVFEQNSPIEIACGNGTNRYGAREIELFKAVLRNDQTYIINKSKSINPEEQALGIIGLEKLIEKGFKLSSKITAISKHIRERNSLISACVTCTSGDYTLKNYLSMYQWNKVPNIELN